MVSETEQSRRYHESGDKLTKPDSVPDCILNDESNYTLWTKRVRFLVSSDETTCHVFENTP